MNEVFQAHLQNAIDLLVKSSAEELPFSDDVIIRVGKAVEAAGFMSAGAFKELAKTNPVSSLLKSVQSAYLLGVSSVVCPDCPPVVPPLIQTTPTSAAEQFGIIAFRDLPNVSGIVTFNHVHPVTIDIEGQTKITQFNFPNCIDVDPTNALGGYFEIFNCLGLTTISMPLFSACDTPLIANNPSLISLDFSAWTGAFTIKIQGNLALQNLSFPALFPSNNKNMWLDGNALTSASVNGVLAKFVANPAYVAGEIHLEGGTNAAPTGQGIIDAATLTGRGVTVTTN